MNIGKPVTKKISDQLYDNMNMQIDRIMIHETSFQIFNKVGDKIWGELLAKVDNQLHNQIKNQIINNL